MNTLSLRNTLYQLKKQYPTRVHYIRFASETNDVKTGKSTQVEECYKLKAILLPEKSKRDTFYARAVVAAGRNFTIEGEFDTATRELIVMGCDLSFVPNERDRCVVDQKRYNIQDIERLAENVGYLLTLVTVRNQKSEDIHNEQIKQTTTLEQT